MERVLGVAIGIAVVCLLLSIIASHVQEVWASYTARRAASLVSAIESMLGKDIAAEFFAHPLIQTISFNTPRISVALQDNTAAVVRPKANAAPRPTYIAASLFSRVLFAVLQERQGMKGSSVAEVVSKLPDSDLKRRLEAVIAGTEEQAHASALAIEQWYDGTMDRINGLYKKDTQQVLLYLGIALAILCNANLFSITEKLWTSEDARAALSATAQMYSCKDGATCADERYQSAREEIMSRQLESYIPVGYHRTGDYWKGIWSDIHKPDTTAASYLPILWGWIMHLAGWGLTGIAVSLGAPFWFDAVNKLINIRLAGDKPARTQPPAIGSQPPPPPDGAVVNVLAPQVNAPSLNLNLPDIPPDAPVPSPGPGDGGPADPVSTGPETRGNS